MRIWAWLTTSVLAVTLSATIGVARPQRSTFIAQNTQSATPATTVTEDGTGYTLSGSGAKTITLSSGVSSGNGVVVLTFTTVASGNVVSACTDNGSGGANSYSLEASANFSSTPTSLQNCSAYIAHSITTITLTAVASS